MSPGRAQFQMNLTGGFTRPTGKLSPNGFKPNRANENKKSESIASGDLDELNSHGPFTASLLKPMWISQGSNKDLIPVLKPNTALSNNGQGFP